jgi:hypothetical protein
MDIITQICVLIIAIPTLIGFTYAMTKIISKAWHTSKQEVWLKFIKTVSKTREEKTHEHEG